MATVRLRSCVEAWPECAEGHYHPSCCRFPKSCSCTVYPASLSPGYLEATDTPTRRSEMTRQVWKFPLAWSVEPQSINVPAGAHIVHVNEQHRLVTLWVEVDTEAPVEARAFVIVGTGGIIPDGAQYLGTVHQNHGAFVFHVYEVRSSVDSNRPRMGRSQA